MFNTTYIWLDRSASIPPQLKTGEHENVSVVFFADQKTVTQLVSLYFSQNETHQFCLALSDLNQGVNLNSISLLLSHPSYARINESIVIFLFDLAENSEVGILAEFLAKQGYTDCEIIVIPNQVAKENPALLITKGTVNIPNQHFATFYHEYLRTSYYDKDVLLLNGNVKDIQATFSDLSKARQGFLLEEPYLGSLIKQVFELNKQNGGLNQVKNLQEEELKTLHDLFSQNAEHKELEYVLHFYRKEYEVLPLWYKRVGHVIKLLTGKRTWRSFRDANK